MGASSFPAPTKTPLFVHLKPELIPTGKCRCFSRNISVWMHARAVIVCVTIRYNISMFMRWNSEGGVVILMQEEQGSETLDVTLTKHEFAVVQNIVHFAIPRLCGMDKVLDTVRCLIHALQFVSVLLPPLFRGLLLALCD